MTFDEKVAEAYHNARENGYNFPTARDWAMDMVLYDSELENEIVADIEASIIRQELI